MRVIHSTVQSPDIDLDRADEYEEVINKALAARDEIRETYSLDGIGQKAYHIALLPYTDPDDVPRWIVFDYGPAEYDYQDTDDLDEAIEAYERVVRAATSSASPSYDDETGDELPVWDETDVEGISAKEIYDGSERNKTARLLDAEWAHHAFLQSEAAYKQDTDRRQIAFAKMVDSWGHGGQAMLSRSIGLQGPTIKAIADRGRRLLKKQSQS